MLKILDRYLIREVALPFVIALVVLTFMLLIPPMLREAESFIAIGARWTVVVRAMTLLMPQALSLTIPVAVLFGILVGFGRLSADREFVAMQAGGVSLIRLLRPVALVAILGTAATAYETIVALPDSNQRFREIAVSVMTDRLENSVKPRVFFEDFPHRVIYVRNLPPGSGWRDVFVADMTRPGYTTVYFAREGHVLVDRQNKLVQLQLIDYSSHTTIADKPEVYEGSQSQSITITLDPKDVFKPDPEKGPPEMTFAELNAAIAHARQTGEQDSPYRFMIQYKWSLPATCPILALIGLGLGASNRKDGWIASIVLGFAVVLVYYILLYGARAVAMGGRMSPEWAAWIPNLITAAAAVALIFWRLRSADRPLRLSLPAFRRRSAAASTPDVDVLRHTHPEPRPVLVLRVPHINLPLPRLLDWYVVREYVRIFFVAVFILIGIFYISTVIDLADKMFRGQATTGMLLRFLYFETPQYLYFVIPMAVLVATLVTLGVMTKNSELMVMRACGISLYRTAMPLMLAAIVAGGFLFVLQEQLLAYTNREADRLNRIMRGYPPISSPLDRRWLVGTSGDMYHYDFYDSRANRFSRLLVYRLDESAWSLKGITYAADAGLTPRAGTGGPSAPVWVARNGWTREFVKGVEPTKAKYSPFGERVVALEAPTYFKSEMPEADLMTYGQLRDYITQLRASGADVVPDVVQLQRKVAFPFVTIIMTLLAVPFAVTTGRRGALYGIGIGIVLAITYRIMESVFGALGAGGVLAPALAAWAPNVLFGAAALYMILTVRT